MLSDHYNPSFLSCLPITFPRFPDLPAELRLKVWQEALPPARTIHLINSLTSLPSPTKPNTSDDDEIVYNRGTIPLPLSSTSKLLSVSRKRVTKSIGIASHCISTVNCPRRVHALIHTCHESRVETMKHYQPLFTSKTVGDPHFNLHYFDPLRDGIFVDEIWPWVRGGGSKPTGLFNARILSISCNAWFFKWDVNSNQLLGKGGLLRFKKLEELHIVHRILTDHERERVMQYNFGQYLGPGDLTQFLRRSHEPYDLAFPNISVDIRIEPILEMFAVMKAANPNWNVPKVKLVAWATRPELPVLSSVKSDLSFS
jgi:hypothetical protein